MELKKLEHAIQVVCECTEQILSHDVRTFKQYRKCYVDIWKYCSEKGIHLQTQEEFEEICSHCTEHRLPYAKKEFRKAAYTVMEYLHTEEFHWNRTPTTKYPVPTMYRHIYDKFQKALSEMLRPSTLRVEISPVKLFLCYLHEIGLKDLSSLTDSLVWDFVRMMTPRYPSCMGRVLRVLKRFLSHLREHGIVELDVERFLVAPATPRKKVLPCLSEDEISGIFSSIDCKSEKGMRDYAVFILSLRLGLRASDITNLKLEDIDWQNSTINITQKKTSVKIVLPLPADAGNAIARYILKARPKADTPYIFLRTTKSMVSIPMSAAAFNKYLREYMSMAGFERKGWDGRSFHALRRTAGTNMLKAGNPLPTISQVLGHRDVESAKRYLALDTEHMRECCLDLGSLHTGKEGLR